MSNSSSIGRTGDAVFATMEKINPELFAMTYGSFVVQLLKDYKDIAVVNSELFKMGYNMGIRMIDEFLAKSNVDRCKDFEQTCRVLAKVGMKMFLGSDTEAVATNDPKVYNLTFSENPLCDFVELPPGCGALVYSNVICGAITGALRMINLVVECEYVQDMLRGAPHDEIRIRLVEVLQDHFEDDDE